MQGKYRFHKTGMRPAKRVFFTNRQHQILIGTAIGDASCSLYKGVHRKTSRITIAHSATQKDYFDWLYAELKKLATTEPRYYEKTNSWRFQTVFSPDYVYYFSITHSSKGRVLPKKLLDQLTLLSLAVFYMDDGSFLYGSRAAQIAMHRYPLSSVKRFCDYLSKKHNLKVKIMKDSRIDKYYIVFNAAETRKFLRLLKPYLPACILARKKAGLDEKRKRHAREMKRKQAYKYLVGHRDEVNGRKRARYHLFLKESRRYRREYARKRKQKLGHW